jgi:beta-galactosidase GanA
MEPAGLIGFLRFGVLPRAGVPTVADLPECVEVSYRSKGNQRYAFYLNHSAAAVTMAVAKPGVELLTQTEVSGSAEIPGFGVLIVKER